MPRPVDPKQFLIIEKKVFGKKIQKNFQCKKCQQILNMRVEATMHFAAMHSDSSTEATTTEAESDDGKFCKGMVFYKENSTPKKKSPRIFFQV